MPASGNGRSLLARLRALRDAPNESRSKTLAVAFLVALFGALLVAGSTILLEPKIEANRAAERQQFLVALIKQIPGIEALLGGIEAGKVTTQVVDLASGRPVSGVDPATLDPRKIAGNPAQTVEIPGDQDLAALKRRPQRMAVYQVTAHGKLQLLILPVYGRGYGGLLFGYLGLAGDLDTVVGLTFYQHSETPGLGALIDSPEWRAKWRGKKLYDEAGALRIGVARGAVPPDSPEARYKVDAITGATFTSRGVDGLVRFWLGPAGYGPYLERLRKEKG